MHLQSYKANIKIILTQKNLFPRNESNVNKSSCFYYLPEQKEKCNP